MRRQLARLGLAVAILVLAVFVLFVVNQTAQVVRLADDLAPGAGRWVLIGLLALYAVLLTVPLVMLMRYPRPLVPPADRDNPRFARHLERLRRRLAANPLLRGDNAPDLSTEEGIQAALDRLGREADREVREIAAVVFVSTAVSQSGRLDALVVLTAQTRMIWRVARVYNQRPPVAELLRLYGNVGATAFVAMGLEEMDISQQVQPLVATVMGPSLAGSVPGLTVLASLVTEAIAEGAANAFLTLRVGSIAKAYCGALLRPDRSLLRRSATASAARMLGPVVTSAARQITVSTYGLARRMARRHVTDRVRSAFRRIFTRGEEVPLDDVLLAAEEMKHGVDMAQEESGGAEALRDPKG